MEIVNLQYRRKRSKSKIFIFLLLTLAGVSFGTFFFGNKDPRNVVPIMYDGAKQKAEDEERGKIIESSQEEIFNTFDIAESIKTTLPENQRIEPQYSVTRYLIEFISSDIHNNPITITAQYFVPQVSTPTKLPLYVFGSGTTGIGDNCAPSKEVPEVANWANYRAHMLAFASQGYIVVFPDYEGFNDPERIHHYFNAELESRVLLDAARSFYTFSEEENLYAKPAPDVFLSGFSQGGHAALSAKDFFSEYAPELTIKGVIAYAPASNIEALLKEAPALSPYLFTAYADLYGKDVIDPEKVLQAKWLPTLETDVNTLCIDKVYKYYGYDAKLIYTPEFYEALFSGTLTTTYPEFKRMLDKNFAGTNESSIPSIILQGATDTIVTTSTVRGVTKRLCNSGNNVTYKEYPNTNHFTIRQNSFKDSLSWMSNIMNSQEPQSNCNTLQ